MLHQPVANFLVRNAFFRRPILYRQVEVQKAQRLFVQGVGVPLLGIGLFRDAPRNRVLDRLFAHFHHCFRHVLDNHQFLALLVDHLALVVHHVVEFQQVFTDFVIALLDLLLGFLKRLVDPRMDNRFAFFEAELAQHAVDAFRSENAHQVVFQRQVEFRAPRIALTA